MDHSLHSCEIHAYETIHAKLKDGRVVELEVNDDGELVIIGEGADDQHNPQPQVMSQQNNQLPQPQISPLSPSDASNLNTMPSFYAPDPKLVASTFTTLPPGARPMNGVAAQENLTMKKRVEDINKFMNDAAQGMAQSTFGIGIGTGSGEQETAKVDNKTWQSKFDNVFKARIMSVMNDNQFDRRLKGRTRGKLDLTRLYKAPTGANSVFTLKQSRRGKKYHVALVVDESGSMTRAQRITPAAEAAQFLAEHFEKIPGVELAIIGFDGRTRVHKNFGDNKNISTLKYSILHSGGGGTGDYKALSKTYRMLKQQRALEDGENIVLFLTDGDSDYGNDRTAALIKANQAIAVTVGMGIQTEARQVPLSMRMRLHDINDMKPKLIEILRRHIRRG